ncbi:MOSC domain-containing protein [Marisediminicola senii]|uniref:MOSC domain-containing protein n=1 Tax=Marisediminicola senii TaxID=2711233 RepID=UPI001F3E80BB|nr:MOSC domain-containing protein [Marisediminicola senii]
MTAPDATAPAPAQAAEPAAAPLPGTVASVNRDSAHNFSKPPVDSVVLLEGLGIEGDVHAGVTVTHRYLVKKDPTRRNLTQVHLIPEELFADLAEKGFTVGAGELGENVTTRGMELLSLPLGTRLHLGETAIVEVTGLRSPCSLINGFQKGLMKTMVSKADDGTVVLTAGIMGVVAAGGVVAPGDAIRVELPAGEPIPLGIV